jgi:hypothetical protein
MNPPLSPLSQNISRKVLTPRHVHSSLSAAMKSALRKLSSFLALCITYAVLGYAFYFLFFASQF